MVFQYTILYSCLYTLFFFYGRDSRHSETPRTGQSGVRTPVGKERFSRPIHIGPKTHPDPCIKGTRSLSPRWNGRGLTLTTHSRLASGSSTCRAIPLTPLSECTSMWRNSLYLFKFIFYITPEICTTTFSHKSVNREEMPFLGAFAKLASACTSSIRPSSWNNSAPTRGIFMKYGIWDYFSKICRGNPNFIKIWQE